ncbi:hypothetical protein [Lacticigenium naphthae]|uniref:hypothetical protein n=1 Tax=Lacticigenium naphthae TaxID=515351 RepID=UPI00042156C2|nr:hypothetical protein [Lacticigenium naphthae]
MPYDFWVTAELFYETILTVLGIMGALIVLILTYVLFYARKRKRKKILVRIAVITLLTIVSISVGGHLYYQDYLNEIRLVNPLVRDRYRTLTGYNYYSRSEVVVYTNLNDLESLRKLSIYSSDLIEEPIDYLGKGQHYYFFKNNNGKIFKQISGVEFSDQVSEATLQGEKFFLTDEKFKEIGFINLDKIMYDKILIPIEMEGKEFKVDFTPDIPATEEVFLKWNVQ